MSQFYLSWNSYKDNVCKGLSSLQEKEEFVDMTLAADGHYVKVHQMVVSLASPYLKELIKSAPCQHPVIFLNKISYPILCCILEYIYSGEVRVSKDKLSELMEAGQALHIKGLQDMSSQEEGYVKSDKSDVEIKLAQSNTNLVGSLQKYKKTSSRDIKEDPHIVTVEGTSRDLPIKDDNDQSDPFNDCDDSFHNDHHNDPISSDDDGFKKRNLKRGISDTPPAKISTVAASSDLQSKSLQYALSNKGSLQLILNRFLYCLRYVYKNKNPPVRQWRCADYERNRCPATVTTQDDMVLQRISAHTHPLHDKKILKKMQIGMVFSAVKEAETQGKLKKMSSSESKTGDEQT